MALFRLIVFPLAAVALLLGLAAPGHAQPFGNRRMGSAPLLARFPIPPQLLRSVRFVPFQQILAETLADKDPAAAEVHTYLRSPVQWQIDLSKQKAWELGLPLSRVIFPDGTIIRTWLRPPVPADWRYHRFTDAPAAGWTMITLFDALHLYEIQAPPGSELLGVLRPGKGGR
jgi:hypothetical protein